MPIKILIADDHEIVRQGLRALLENQAKWAVVGEAVTGREAVEKAKQFTPDVAIIDIGMPELNGLAATRQILKVMPQTEVLILTMHVSEQIVREVVASGARGYVLKSDAGQDLVAAVEALCQHRTFFSSTISEMLRHSYSRQSDRAEPTEVSRSRLTTRESEIVQLLAEGKSNKEVAQTLGISVKTAETHRTNIFNKLDLRSIAELVHYAVRNKIVEP